MSSLFWITCEINDNNANFIDKTKKRLKFFTKEATICLFYIFLMHLGNLFSSFLMFSYFAVDVVPSPHHLYFFTLYIVILSFLFVLRTKTKNMYPIRLFEQFLFWFNFSVLFPWHIHDSWLFAVNQIHVECYIHRAHAHSYNSQQCHLR